VAVKKCPQKEYDFVDTIKPTSVCQEPIYFGFHHHTTDIFKLVSLKTFTAF